MKLVFIKKKSTIEARVTSKERKEPDYKSTPLMAHIAERGYPRTSKAQGKPMGPEAQNCSISLFLQGGRHSPQNPNSL